MDNLKVLKENLQIFTQNLVNETFSVFTSNLQTQKSKFLYEFVKMDEIKEEKEEMTDSPLVLSPANKN